MTDSNTEHNYEHNFERLQQVVSRLEGEGLGLEESLDLFEEGMELVACCDRQLTDAETRVKVLLSSSERLEPRADIPFEAVPLEQELE